MNLREFIWKSYKTIHNNRCVKNYRTEKYTDYCERYPACRFLTKKIKKDKNGKMKKNYFAARPNPGAGIGHQMANWIAGYWYAKFFNLEFAHIPFSNQHYPFKSDKWDEFLGFGAGEITVIQLLKKGYKPVLLPLFDENKTEEIAYIRKTINAYKNKKVVFVAEQDQFFKAQYPVMKELQQKFYSAPSRKNDRLLFNPNHKNVVIHMRRGDIVQKGAEKNPNLTMRFLKEEYFINIIDYVLKKYGEDDNVDLYLMSQGNKEDFGIFEKYTNMHLCLELDEIDSFLAMVYADVLITSKSSFSYKPALLNKDGIKICPADFWHEYPNDDHWILADENGRILDRRNNHE